jgi:hypothetical protein
MSGSVFLPSLAFLQSSVSFDAAVYGVYLSRKTERTPIHPFERQGTTESATERDVRK